MLHINETKIEDILSKAGRTSADKIDAILEKSKSLKRLSLDEVAALLLVEDPVVLRKIFGAAAQVKDAIYGRRVVLFAPLYISNVCANACVYCAFKSDNMMLKRRTLSLDDIRKETEHLLAKGHKRILMVAGEINIAGVKNIDYYVEAIKVIYAARVGPNAIRRVNINCAPLSTVEFKRLKAAGIGTYQIFQETYHDKTYRLVHPSGPKSDPDNRIEAIDRAFEAGIDDVGVGVLYGLYDYRFDTLGLIMHIEYLEKKFGVGPHTISVPRIEPAFGAEFTTHLLHKVSDADFKKIVAILRLAVPYTGIILSTRENAEMRDELFNIGVSQVSAESKTSPGGYTDTYDAEGSDTQFSLNDHRSLDEVVGSLLAKGNIPSFCAACYRKERTGEAFMDLAKPGAIKNKCNINALITLKEYLEDFASQKTRKAGCGLIKKMTSTMNKVDQAEVSRFFELIDNGTRDTYV